MFGVTHAAIQFPIYEYLKQVASGIISAYLTIVYLVYICAETKEVSNHVQTVLIASVVSKTIATILIFPHEVFVNHQLN